METEITIKPQICEQTRQNMWNRIAAERNEQKNKLKANYETIIGKLQEVSMKDQESTSFSKFNPEVVFSRK